MNDTTKEEFEKMSDSEKQEVRKAKENYLNNKHRLDEITPTIGLMEVLDGKDPKDKFIEIEDLIKTVENKFNRDSLDEIVEVIGKDENQEENWYDPKGFEDALKEAQERKAQREEQEAIYAQMSKEEFAKAYNPNYKGQSQGQGQGQGQNQGQGQSQGQGQNSKYEIVLNISKNKINVNGNENLFYKEESKNKKELIEKYAINSYFSQYKKEKKSIDYALISTLENIDENNKIGLVDDYLSLIRGSAIGNKSIEEIKEEFNNAVEIEYKFADEPLLSNLKEKKIARNAKKLGIATLDGISEKSLSDKIRESFSKVISKMKSTKLLKGKEKQKALGSGEITNAEKQKVKDRVKVDNRDNRIEKNATLNNLVKADEKQQPETEQGRDVDDWRADSEDKIRDTNEEKDINWEEQYDEELKEILQKNEKRYQDIMKTLKNKSMNSNERYSNNIENVSKQLRKQSKQIQQGFEWKNGNVVPKEVTSSTEETR